MRKSPTTPKQGTLDQFAGIYMTARWYLGAGLIALTLIMAVIDEAGPEIWAIAAVGAVILAHVSAMRIWGMNDSTTAVLLDVTAIGLATMFTGTATDDYLPASLTFVGAATLISLFIERRIMVLILVYMALLTLASMLVIRDWDLLAVADVFLASTFVVVVVSAVISSIRNRLVEVEAARAQTIGVVSHELRNHLTGVIGAVELINDDESKLGPDETDELLQLAYQQSVEAEEIIEDLLIASRAEKGVLNAIVEPVDLALLTETVIRRTSVESSQIIYDFSHGPIGAMADPLRYKQIVRNLLTNAQRYGGDAIRVSIEKVDGMVSVTVADNGEGIDVSDVSSLFQAYRGGRASQGVSGSTGLGLWIARSLAQKMDGELTYERRSGQTVFELTLPTAPLEAIDDTAGEPTLSSSRS